MKDQYNIDDSYDNGIKPKKDNEDVADFSVSVLSIVSNNEVNENKQIEKRASQASIHQSKPNKNNTLLSSGFLIKGADQDSIGKVRAIMKSRTEISSISEEHKIQINSISDISLFKETMNDKVVYFYKIKGDISQDNRDDAEDGKPFHYIYDSLEVPIEMFTKGKRTIFDNPQLDNDIKNISKFLNTYTEYISNFFLIGDKLMNAYNKVLKYVDFQSYLLYIINLKDEIQIEDKALGDKIRSITVEDIKKNISPYITHLLGRFNDMVLPYKNCENVYQVIDLLKLDIKKIKDEIEKYPMIDNFTIVKNMIEIMTKIQSFLFLSIDKGTKNTALIKEFNALQSSDISTNNQMDVTNSENSIIAYQNFIQSIVYSILLKVNNYYKENFPICCGSSSCKDINYVKSPYIFCFNCKMLICKKCFMNHINHHYFDIACTLKKKIGNIHSSISQFLNSKNNNYNGDLTTLISNNSCEDLLLNLMLNYVHFDIDDFLKQKYYTKTNEKSVDISVMNLIDVFLFEFLFKAIYPIIIDDGYFNYIINTESDENNKNSLVHMIHSFENIDDKHKKENINTNHEIKEEDLIDNTIFIMYYNYKEKEKNEHTKSFIAKIMKKTKEPKGKIEPKEISIPEEDREDHIGEKYDDENSSECISGVADISMSVINRCPVIKETYFLNDSLDTFPYVLSSYKTFKERTKVKVDEEEADKENKMNVVIKLDKEKKIVREPIIEMHYPTLTEDKKDIDTFIKEMLNVNYIEQYEKYNYLTKWFYLEKESNAVKYIDGFGSVYEYISMYISDIFTSITTYNNFKFALDDNTIITLNEDDYI